MKHVNFMQEYAGASTAKASVCLRYLRIKLRLKSYTHLYMPNIMFLCVVVI